MVLGGKHGVSGHSRDLRTLDLGVPVGALHQPHADLPARAPGQLAKPVNDPLGPLAVALHRQSQAVPSRQRLRFAQPFGQFQRQDQPVGFLRIQAQGNIVLPGQLAQLQQTRNHLRVHPRALPGFVARMQRGQLDGHARAAPGGAGVDFPHHRDGFAIGPVVVVGHLRGARPFAENIERILHAVVQPAGAPDGGFHGLAHHELLPQDAHGAAHGGADYGLAQTADKRLQHRAA